MASRWLGTAVDADPSTGAAAAPGAGRRCFNGRGPPGIVREHRARLVAAQHGAGGRPDAPRAAAHQRARGRRAAVVGPARRDRPDRAPDARRRRARRPAYRRHLRRAGMVLLAEGHPEMLEAAAANHFVPGALLGENAAGTNAIGTTLYLDHPLQIFSAEHFKSLFHGWTCSAAPIHDPVSGALLGAIDLSGNFRTAHPHSVSLVTAVARLVESRLALDAARRDAHLRDRYLALVMRDSHRPSALVTRRAACWSRARRRGSARRSRCPPAPTGSRSRRATRWRSSRSRTARPSCSGRSIAPVRCRRARRSGSSRSAGRERRSSRSAGRSS